MKTKITLSPNKTFVMKQLLLLACMVLLFQNVQAQPPVINSFSPTSGPVGTSVTISGSNFSPVPANNIVYLGAVRASLTEASATSLTVVVPTGATHQPLSVTVNGLTGFANSSFVVTFDKPFLYNPIPNMVAPPTSFTSIMRPGWATAVGDFDGDGKADIAVTKTLATYVNGPNTGYTFFNLPAGIYNLRIRSALGCESVNIQRTIQNRNINCPPAAPAITGASKGLVLEETGVESKLKVSSYPNPSRGLFKLQLQGFATEKAELMIYDAKGTLVQRRIIAAGKNNVVEVNLTGKAKGLYYLKVVGGKDTISTKVIVQ
jgi:hypothetical protein